MVRKNQITVLTILNLIILSSCITKDDIPNFEKYYKPAEIRNMDMFASDSKFSWTRYKQSDHYFVFWEPGFGADPNASSVPSNLRVDVDDLIEKAEQFYKTNIEKCRFATVGNGKSYLDKYKTQIILLYTTDWVATGGGYDDVIGALWVSPSTCHPVGSTIAHEIGHSFQYQVYADQVLNGINANSYKSGFRYGYGGSNGGCGFWEQTAQWQSFQDYPEQIFDRVDFLEVWPNNCHRHFEHEWQRYASYWYHYYWQSKHGLSVIGDIWRNSKYPEDAIMAYMRLFNGNDYSKQQEELFDYASKMATFDIDSIRKYGRQYLGRYKTSFIENGGYYQIAYGSCPGATGFNIITLKKPSSEDEISVEFVGLEPGSALAPGDPGKYKKNDAFEGTVTSYNSANKGNTGWRYGFVAHLSDDSRVYSDVFTEPKGTAKFKVPNGTSTLYMIVQGCPEKYIVSPWDEDERTDAQFPYKLKFTNTGLAK